MKPFLPLALVLSFLPTSLAADSSRDKSALVRLVGHSVEAKKLIEHEVEWKSTIDATRRQSLLAGPRLFCEPASPAPDASELVLFSCYELQSDKSAGNSRPTTWSGRISEREQTFRLGEAKYFLSATQHLSDGPPASFPERLSHFVAYSIVGGGSETTPTAPASDLSRPAFVCIPAEEWHHDEHFPVRDPLGCWVVYETTGTSGAREMATLDQFGLNRLELRESKWLCLPARMTEGNDEGS